MTRIRGTKLEVGTPLIGWDVAIAGLPVTAKKVTSAELVRNVTSLNQVEEAFGKKSYVYNLCKAYFGEDDLYETNLHLVKLVEDGAATATTITVTFATDATSDGQIVLKFFDGTEYTVDVTNGDSVTDIAAAFVTKFTAVTDLPFTASNTLGVLTLTCDTLGGVGAKCPIKLVSSSVSGTTVTVGAPVAGTNPADFSDFFSLLKDEHLRVNIFLADETATVSDVEDGVDSWKTINDESFISTAMLYGKVDTYANLITNASSINNTAVVQPGLKPVSIADTDYGNHSDLDPNYLSARVLGTMSVCYTPGADCSTFLPDNPIGSLNNIAIPLAKLAYSDLSVRKGYEWIQDESGDEVRGLTDNGVFVFRNNRLNYLSYGDVVTTSLTDTNGTPMSTYKYVQASLISNEFMNYVFTILDAKYQHKILDAETVRSIQSDLITMYKVCSDTLTDEFGNRFKWLDISGLGEYTDSVIEVVSVNYVTGRVTFDELKPTMLSGLRDVIYGILFKQATN